MLQYPFVIKRFYVFSDVYIIYNAKTLFYNHAMIVEIFESIKKNPIFILLSFDFKHKKTKSRLVLDTNI